MTKATTVRFADEVFARLDQASARTGLPVNSIVVAACLEWMDRHTPPPNIPGTLAMSPLAPAPRWSTIRRAVEVAVGGRQGMPMYPFERFTETAQKMLTVAQAEAQKSGFSYIGTEHLLLAAFTDASWHSAMVLASLGVGEQSVRKKLAWVLYGKASPANPRIVPTSRVKKVIELAFKLCGAAGDPRVSTAHVLFALAAEKDGIAAHVLKDAGATTERIGTAMEALTEPEA